MNRSISYCLVISIIIVNIVFLGSPAQAEQQNQQIPIELKVTCNGLDKLLNSANKQTAITKNTSKNANNTGNILQLVGDMIGAVEIALIVISIILSGLALGIFNRLTEYQKSFKDAKNRIAKYEKRIKQYAKRLDETDTLTTIKISAIQQTLILCLEKAPTRDIAFSTYSKLLAAYEVLLDKSHGKDIGSELHEKMEMAATLVYGNKQYVPDEIIRFMIEHMNLPYEVRGILWGSS